jgi:hypothetical protein
MLRAGGVMQRVFAILVLVTTLLNGGCGIIYEELHNRGGYLDYIADEHWFKADSKKMRALRAFALQASLVRIASVAPKNAEARTLLAIRIGKTTERANLVLDCAFNGSRIPVVLGEPCFYFDSLMVDYTNALIDFAMISFPIEDTKRACRQHRARSLRLASRSIAVALKMAICQWDSKSTA